MPMRHRGTTDDIGKAALFLASDLASYVNGTTLDVDGGLLSQTCSRADCLEVTKADFTSRIPAGNVARRARRFRSRAFHEL